MEFKQTIKQSQFSDILGQNFVKNNVKSALVMDRHILIVGAPGIGKTTLAKNIAKLLGKKIPFIRIQGSPDLTVEDLLGDIDPIKALKYGPLS
ncbi:MoxR family ATPase, partial [Candidatus Woesearchaeota archaeon]|nr:MoxR family ATPase [Candidatus Woesearchaeota archaeon]